MSVVLSRQYRPFTKLPHRFNMNPAFKASSCAYTMLTLKMILRIPQDNVNSGGEYLAIDLIGGNSRVCIIEIDQTFSLTIFYSITFYWHN